jgi:hypothetical protein
MKYSISYSAAKGFDRPIFPVDARFWSHAIPSGAVKLNLNQPSQRADSRASQIEDEAQRWVNGLYLFWANHSLAR